MSENLKRMLTFLVAVAMVFSMMPMTAMADNTSTVEPEESVGPRDPAISGGTEPTEPETEPSEPEETTEPSDVRSLYVHPLSIIEGTVSTWDEESESYSYDWYTAAYYEVEMADGTTYAGSNGFEHNGVYYRVGGRSDQIENPWTADNTYEATFVLTNDSTGEEYTQQVEVTITPTPVDRIEIQPIVLLENVNGFEQTDSNNETFFFYWWYDRINWTVYYKDGTSHTGSGTTITYGGREYEILTFTAEQQETHWTKGTYPVTARFMGVSTEFHVEITDIFVRDIQVKPIEIKPGTTGGICENQNGTRYYGYDWWQNLEYTVEFIDGTSYSGTGTDFVYNGKEYSLETLDNQSYENQWTPGNTYTVQVRASGYTKDVSVTILESPVRSITLQPIRLYERCTGGMNTYYPDGPGSQPMLYYTYYWHGYIKYEVEFEDGTRQSGQGGGFSYQNQWYSFYGFDNQNYDNQWVVGGNYQATVSVLGMVIPVTVSIVESPVRNVVFEPVSIEEHTNGNWLDSPTGQYYGYENWASQLKYTVYFTDNTSINGQGWGFYYNGEYVRFNVSDDQHNNRWLAGNTYEGTVDLHGKSYTVPVSIYRQNDEGGFRYLVQSEQAIINDCTLTTETLTVPATLGGYPVVGITSLGNAVKYAKTIEIPDSVTMLSANVFRPDQWTYSIPLEHLTLGAGITQIDVPTLSTARDLLSITVSVSNPVYASVDGVLYTKNVTAMVVYPAGRRDVHVVPDTVTDVDILFDNSDLYYNANVQMGAGVEDYVTENGVIYNKDKTEIVKVTGALSGDYVMPDTVTTIGDCAFAYTKITSVTVSRSVKEIAYATFAGCKSLKNVVLPEGIESIGRYAFSDCDALESVTIPSTVQYIGVGAFCNGRSMNVYATDIESWLNIEFIGDQANPLFQYGNLYFQGELVEHLEIPDGVTEIGSFVFAGLRASSVSIPQSVTKIGESAFYSADIYSVSLSEGLLEIEAYAFEGTSLREVTLPNSLDYLGQRAFAECRLLESVHIGTGLTRISGGAFANTGLQSVTIPKQVELIESGAFAYSKLQTLNLQCDHVEISDYAFVNCPLGDLELGDNVAFLGYCAFDSITSTQVKLPAGVTQLTYRIFGECRNLVSVTIPDSVTYICEDAFEDSINLSHVLYTGTSQQWDDVRCESPEIWDAVVHCNATGDEVTTQLTCNKIIYTCSICNETKSVRRADPSHEFVDGVCTVCGQEGYWEYETDPLTGKVTIYGYSNWIDDLVIPSTIGGKAVNAIAPRAFADRTDIQTVTMPDSVVSVGESAFANCQNMRSITLSKNITSIADDTFRNCYNLTGIELPEGVTYIGANAFTECGLVELELNEGLEYIDSNAFYNCWSLEALKLPSTVKYISYYAFSGTGIDIVVIPASVEELKDCAFAYCYGLEEIYFQGNAIWSCDVFDCVTADAYYPASNATWQNERYDPNMLGGKLSWHAVAPAVVTAQSQSASAGVNGEVFATVEAQGKSLSYQWYYAAPGSAKFEKAEQGGQTFTTVLDESKNAVLAYCEITDLVGQTVRSDTVALNRVHGDMDANGTMDSRDVVALLLHVSMPEHFSVYGFADLDANGAVNVDDVLALLLAVSLPADFSL